MYRPASIVLFKSDSSFAFGIKTVQKKVKFTKEESEYTHVGIIIKEDGTMYEALGKYGMVKSNIALYNDKDYIILEKPNANFAKIVEEAHKLYKGKRTVYQDISKVAKYDWWLITGLFFVALGAPVSILKIFNVRKYFVCSEFVIQAYENAGEGFGDSSLKLYPAFIKRLANLGKLKIIEEHLHKL